MIWRTNKTNYLATFVLDFVVTI